jgi:hypothetical protein
VASWGVWRWLPLLRGDPPKPERRLIDSYARVTFQDPPAPELTKQLVGRGVLEGDNEREPTDEKLARN